MENWGITVYRENVMLDRHKNQSKEVFALVLMCHELAHNVRTLLTIKYALW